MIKSISQSTGFFAVRFFALFFFPVFISAQTPQGGPGIIDTLGLSAADSLGNYRFMLEQERSRNHLLSLENDSLRRDFDELSVQVDQLKQRERELVPLNEALNRKIVELGAELHARNLFLEEQIRLQKEKEQLFAEKEQIYKDAVNSSLIDKVKLEGLISARDSRLEGKEREIGLLQQRDRKSVV